MSIQPRLRRRPALRFQIRISGILSDHWKGRFEGVEVVHLPEGDTLVSGKATDEPALFGVLRVVESLGVRVVSIAAWPAGGGRV